MDTKKSNGPTCVGIMVKCMKGTKIGRSPPIWTTSSTNTDVFVLVNVGQSYVFDGLCQALIASNKHSPISIVDLQNGRLLAISLESPHISSSQILATHFGIGFPFVKYRLPKIDGS